MPRKPTKMFNNINDFYNHFDTILEQCLKDIAKDYQEKLKNFIKRNWYDKYVPKTYTRTNEGDGSFLDSITFEIKKNKRNNYECYIYADPSLMNVTIYNDNDPHVWNSHADIYGNDVREGIPIWINTGNGASPLYQYAGCGWTNWLYNMVQLHFKTDLKIMLSKHGIQTK